MENEVFMRFENGLEKAVTFSYDDGVASDRRLKKLFDDNGIKCTFNLNSGVFGNNAHGRMNKEDAVNLYKGGEHEVASHGFKHLFLTKTDVPRGIDEVLSDKKELEKLFDTVVCGFAYPYGAFSEEIKNYLSLTGIRYARTTVSTRRFDIPKDFLELNPTCHHGDAELFSLTDKFVNTYPHDSVKEREPYLFYVWGHSYEFDGNDNWDIIEKLVARVAKRKDVAYVTNAEVSRSGRPFRTPDEKLEPQDEKVHLRQQKRYSYHRFADYLKTYRRRLQIRCGFRKRKQDRAFRRHQTSGSGSHSAGSRTLRYVLR